MTVDRNPLPVLSRQLEFLSHRGEVFQTRDQEERDWFVAVQTSLRSTVQMLSSGRDPRGAVHDFVLEVSEAGSLILKQAGLTVPVDDDYLVQVFETIGIDLVPGQVLVLDPQMAHWAIEESLWGLELERSLAGGRGSFTDAGVSPVGAWSRKRDLVTAGLIAEELLELPLHRSKAV